MILKSNINEAEPRKMQACYDYHSKSSIKTLVNEIFWRLYPEKVQFPKNYIHLFLFSIEPKIEYAEIYLFSVCNVVIHESFRL